MTVGERLVRWRSARGLNQRQAAKLADVSQAAWQAVERDRVKRIGLEVATRISGVTDGEISLDDLREPRGDDSGPLETEDASLHAKAAG